MDLRVAFIVLLLCFAQNSEQNALKFENSRDLQASRAHKVGVRMIHRSSPQSPDWKPHYVDRTELLGELMEMDKERLEGFRRQLKDAQSGHHATQSLPRHTIARIDKPIKRISTKIFSGSSVGNGQYFAEIRIGSPPQKFHLIVDTGSDLTWVQCHSLNRTKRYHKSISYKRIPCTSDECLLVPAPENSTCSVQDPKPCDYTYQYSDRSRTTGILAYETFWMRSSRHGLARIQNVAFGCSELSTGQSFLGASGVLGLGQGPVSFTTQVGSLLGGVFSYCLVDYLSLAGSNISSVLMFGEPSLHMRHTPIVRNPFMETFYYVNVLHILLNDKVVEGTDNVSSWTIDKNGNGGTIFDSGTTLSYLKENVYSKVVQALNNSIELPRVEGIQGFELCYNVSSTKNRRYPKLGLVFQGGGVMELPENNYMVMAVESVKCVAFQSVRTKQGVNVIGNLMQQDFRIEYNRVKKRIGFKWSPCSSKHKQ